MLSALQDDELGRVMTCYAPVHDLEPQDGKPSLNFFASVGTDPLLGAAKKSWRQNSAPSASPRMLAASSSPSELDLEIERLLGCDSPAEQPGEAMLEFSQPLHLSASPKDPLEHQVCTTCWNVASAKRARQVELPETAMGLGTSKLMSEEERSFMADILAGRSPGAFLADDDEAGQLAARLAAMDSPQSSSTDADTETDTLSSAGVLSASMPRGHGSLDTSQSSSSAAVASVSSFAHAAGSASDDDEGDDDDVLSLGSDRGASDKDSSCAAPTSKRPRRQAAARAVAFARAVVSATTSSSSSSSSAEAYSADDASLAVTQQQQPDEAFSPNDEADASDNDDDDDVYMPPSMSSAVHSASSATRASVTSSSSSSSSSSKSRASSNARSRQLPESAVAVLKAWMLSPEHFGFPWPNAEEKAALAQRAGIDGRQLGVWLTNARKRLWAPLRRRLGLPVVRYAEAKAVRERKAVVESVTAARHAASSSSPKSKPKAKSTTSPKASMPPPAPVREAVLTSSSSSSSAPRRGVIPEAGLARVQAALRAQEALLQAQRAELEGEAEVLRQRQGDLLQLHEAFTAAAAAPLVPLALHDECEDDDEWGL